jgi:lipopolysaccharide/colanic/teichoic acid biosynthesis glycosyltransferase
MSLVGPRPLIPAEAAMIGDEYSARFGMRPGITGPWQALGRSDIPFEDMSKLDYTYCRTWTMGEDLRILTRTLGAVAHGRGAY